jgi:hypothetical protein
VAGTVVHLVSLALTAPPITELRLLRGLKRGKDAFGNMFTPMGYYIATAVPFGVSIV